MRRVDIDKNLLSSLIEKGYTNSQLAEHFNCNISTIKRRKAAYDLLGISKHNNPQILKDSKKCSSCEELLHISNFCKRKDTKHGYCARCRLCESIRHKEYYQENIDKFRAADVRRRTGVKKAIPAWYSELDELVLQEMHDLAKLRKDALGIQYHIDHIIPLKNDLVCGLHWHKNWQLITAEENLSKSNKLLEKYINV